MPTRESVYERKFVQWIKSIGGECPKGPAMLYKGIPDRIAILPNGGGTVWVEFKNDTGQLSAMQRYWRDKLLSSSYDRYFIAVSQEGLDNCIEKCKELMNKKPVDNSTLTSVSISIYDNDVINKVIKDKVTC